MIEINNEYVSKCLLRCLKQAESNYGKALVQTDGLNKYSMLLMWTILVMTKICRFFFCQLFVRHTLH